VESAGVKEGAEGLPAVLGLAVLLDHVQHQRRLEAHEAQGPRRVHLAEAHRPLPRRDGAAIAVPAAGK
jgi:hypothetical protein